MDPVTRISQLRDEIRRHEDRYYIQNDPEITDEAFDALVKELEATMAAPGFFADLEASKPVTDRHQALMWEVGDLIAQWEALQEHAAEQPSEP